MSMMLPEPPGGPEPATDNAVELLKHALVLARQATETEQDPQMRLQIEKISTLIQQVIAQDHGQAAKAIGVDPGMLRVLASGGR